MTESLSEIIDCAGYMSAVLKDQLRHSKIDKAELLVDNVDMNIVVEKAIQQFRSEIRNYSILVTHDSLPTVIINKIQFIRIFQNLISNAIKYRSNDRPCSIHISFKDAGDFYIFSVADNGIGIHPGELKNIFKLFHQANKENASEGAGIGLSSCKKIIESYGGEVWVESNIGKGSTFYFSIKR